MGWKRLLGRSRPEARSVSTSVLDVTDNETQAVVDVTLSIHAAPPSDSRFGAALCMLSHNDRVESTGSVVTIGNRPHVITRRQFEELLSEAAETGHLVDGFLEIEAVVDLDHGTITWQPENGEGVTLSHLDTVVENTLASLVETNVFGEWFAPRKIGRAGRTSDHAISSTTA